MRPEQCNNYMDYALQQVSVTSFKLMVSSLIPKGIDFWWNCWRNLCGILKKSLIFFFRIHEDTIEEILGENSVRIIEEILADAQTQEESLTIFEEKFQKKFDESFMKNPRRNAEGLFEGNILKSFFENVG